MASCDIELASLVDCDRVILHIPVKVSQYGELRFTAAQTMNSIYLYWLSNLNDRKLDYVFTELEDL